MENDKGPDDIVIDAAVEGRVPADCVAVILYTTFPTHEAAVNAGRALVEGRVAGCVNIIPAMTSIYVWDGKTEVAAEAVLMAKMPAEAFPAAAQAVQRLHPYDTPTILALPVFAGNVAYLDWLRRGTDQPM